MKKTILIAATLCFCSMNMKAQDTTKEEGFVFTTVKENPITSIKNQRTPHHKYKGSEQGGHLLCLFHLELL